jgi:hypothetical protein
MTGALAVMGLAAVAGECEDRPVPTDPANSMLRRAARDTLRPLGMIQKGRSRTWLDDHGWWLILVEFQPSGFGKGSYLNVGISWLWKPGTVAGVLTYDLGHRVAGFRDYQSPEQWEEVSAILADRAREQVLHYRERVPNLVAAADETHVAAQANERGWSGWLFWNAGLANGLVGNVERAGMYLGLVASSSDDQDWWLPVRAQADIWKDLVVTDRSLFVDEVTALTREHRQLLALPPGPPPPMHVV